jgi:hypothetical protein
MSLRLMLALTSLSSILTVSPVVGEVLTIDAVMDKQEQESIGLDRLSPPERQAFERWVDKWTRNVIQQAPTYHPSLTLSQWVAGWPGYLKPTPIPKKEAAKEKKEANQTIFRNKGGSVLELKDGSVWNITQIDQPVVQLWRRGQKITITTNTGNPYDIVRPYILFNEARNEQAGGTRAKAANPDGQRTSDNPAYFRNSVIITSITSDGITVTLATGDVWIVAPTGQQLVQNTWTKGDRIRVDRSTDAAYRYRLVNLDSGDSVLANPPNKRIAPNYYQQ